MNFIVGISCDSGIPFNTLMFLSACSTVRPTALSMLGLPAVRALMLSRTIVSAAKIANTRTAVLTVTKFDVFMPRHVGSLGNLCPDIFAGRDVGPVVGGVRPDVVPYRENLIVPQIAGLAGDTSVGRETDGKRNGDDVIRFLLRRCGTNPTDNVEFFSARRSGWRNIFSADPSRRIDRRDANDRATGACADHFLLPFADEFFGQWIIRARGDARTNA